MCVEVVVSPLDKSESVLSHLFSRVRTPPRGSMPNSWAHTERYVLTLPQPAQVCDYRIFLQSLPHCPSNLSSDRRTIANTSMAKVNASSALHVDYPVHPKFERWRIAAAGLVPAFAEPELGRGVAESSFVRSRHLGTASARHGGGSCESAKRGREPQGRGGHPSERCRQRLSAFARTGLRVGDLEGNARHPAGFAEPHHRTVKPAALPPCSICARPSNL